MLKHNFVAANFGFQSSRCHDQEKTVNVTRAVWQMAPYNNPLICASIGRNCTWKDMWFKHVFSSAISSNRSTKKWVIIFRQRSPFTFSASLESISKKKPNTPSTFKCYDYFLDEFRAVFLPKIGRTSRIAATKVSYFRQLYIFNDKDALLHRVGLNVHQLL